MRPAPFEVEEEVLGDDIVAFAVRGELDMNTAPDLERRMEPALAAGVGAVLLDLSGCEFIDSTGIALIVRSWQRLDRDAVGDGEGRFVLACDNHQVRRLLGITGVEDSISMRDSREAALAELRSAA